MNTPELASLSRRQLLGRAALLGTTAALAPNLAAGQDQPPAASAEKPRVKYCLNMSTIREQKLSLPEQVDLAAKAGYDAIEPWMRELQSYVDGGGSASDLRKRIAEHGLAVASAIGFAEWIVDDDARRAAGLETAKRDMGLLASIGGTHIAAPPAGATQPPSVDLLQAADRYHALLEVGVQEGVIPQLEVWGFSASLSRLGETMLVATQSKHPRACVLLDVYHLHKGGSGFAGLRLLSGGAMHCFHMNDFPAEPPRESIRDADRVYPGDGVAPLTQILRDMFAAGFRDTLSLELFNPTYWKQDPLQVASTGLAKMKEAVAKAIA
jgi:sugar phosphate isomerase/epimerase